MTCIYVVCVWSLLIEACYCLKSLEVYLFVKYRKFIESRRSSWKRSLKSDLQTTLYIVTLKACWPNRPFFVHLIVTKIISVLFFFFSFFSLLFFLSFYFTHKALSVAHLPRHQHHPTEPRPDVARGRVHRREAAGVRHERTWSFTQVQRNPGRRFRRWGLLAKCCRAGDVLQGLEVSALVQVLC